MGAPAFIGEAIGALAALVNAALTYAAFRTSTLLWAIALALLVGLTLVLAVLTVRTLRIVFDRTLFL